MGSGRTGTFVISWAETKIDGFRGGPVAGLELGVTWSWSGRAIRVDGSDTVLNPGSAIGQDRIRERAALAARRFVGRALPPVLTQSETEAEDPLFSQSFTVTDGRRRWTGTLVEVPEAARPLVMFLGGLPPERMDLTVVEAPEPTGHLHRVASMPTGVICFTRGTRLRTPRGDVAVEDLAEGDRLQTRDGGAEEIVWIGRRRMTGARLYAMPDLRPIRIRNGALGVDVPEGDLIVSPRHRVLIRDERALALYGESEVLVAAEDLVNDHSILRDVALREVEYIHLLLPRHHVVWANGVETESFHPASTDLTTIEPGQRARLAERVPEIEADPFSYGAPARRELTRAEAAVLNYA